MTRFIEALEHVAKQRAEHPAITDTEGTLSYAELWSRVEALRKNFAERARRISLLQGERGVEFVAQTLACWHAQSVPLLLSKQVPPGRISELAAVIEHNTLPDGIEYAVTTSGSNGKPKVVLICHGSLLITLKRQIQAFQIRPHSRVLWMLSPSFDASLSDIGTALLAGAHLFCGAPQIETCLVDAVRTHRITHLDIPPSVLALLRPGDFPSHLKTLVVGGEPSDPAVLRAWCKTHRVVSVYGPSEATVCTSLSVVDDSWDRPYLGIPFEEVTYSVKGRELLIHGDQVGQGYLDGTRGGFCEIDGQRCFATGDRVGCFHPRHGWEFLGRFDRQVKIRGQRVELQEVEERIRGFLGHPNAAVLVVNGDVVAAYAGEESPSLPGELAYHLPSAWLPARYCHLAELPRTESRKIDYATLRAELEESSHSDSLLTDSLQTIQNALELERGQRSLHCAGLRNLGDTFLQGHQLLQTLPPTPSARSRRHGRRKKLLLTGAGGRLGRSLYPRLKEEFEVWTLQRNPDRERCFKADLEAPDFALGEESWAVLSEETDEILHLAAGLNLTRSYSELARLNVQALATLARLGKPIHHASSLAATLSSTRPTLGGPLQPEAVIIGGYAQSKWAAEALLERLPLPGHTFRLGHLLGLPDRREWLSLVVRGLRAFGCAPKRCRKTPLYFDFTPLEWAADEIFSHLATPPRNRSVQVIRRGWAIHYLDLLDALKENGIHLEQVEAESFFQLKTQNPESRAAHRALMKLHPRRAELGWEQYDLFLLGNLPEACIERADSRALTLLKQYVSQALSLL